MNPIASAASSLIAASNRFDRASLDLSTAASGGTGDVARAVADQIAAKIQVEASAKVLKAIAQTNQDTLNILV